MGDKSVEYLRREAEHLIKGDIDAGGAVTAKTWQLASVVYSDKEIKDLVLKYGGDPLVRPIPPADDTDGRWTRSYEDDEDLPQWFSSCLHNSDPNRRRSPR